jgi:hypothetical protein
MRFGKLIYVAAALTLVTPVATWGESLSILSFFQDGCGATAPEAVRFCKGGSRAGSACIPQPEFDPDNPNFSPDCCANLNQCFTNDPANECADGTRRRCTRGSSGNPCSSDSDCDSLVCVGGDPNSLGETCSTNTDCANPFNPEDPNAICAGSQDGECTLDTSGSIMGHVMKVNDDVALFAVMNGVSFIPQPQNKRKDRLQYEFNFQLVDAEFVVLIDGELCGLPIHFRKPMTPTQGIIEGALGNGTP